eukprot:TRINITY_DN12200_c0_g1_i1.p1 TRINITY_DN12200_c0_g1~~TRINITY_DN12200_c0_g1_i1.p1  ORF type:complete len:290 (+),score=52.27 TRINITY_DN12200_c0_g1_i1:294-1163(+)
MGGGKGRKGGRGNYGSPYGGWQAGKGSWNGQQKGGASGDPFSAVTDMIDGAISSCQSLARMTQLGTTLAAMQATPATQPSAQIPGNTSSMSSSLISAINNNGGAAAPTSGEATDFEARLQQSALFKGISGRMEAVETRLTEQGQELRGIRNEQSSQSTMLRRILETVEKGPGVNPPPPAERGAPRAGEAPAEEGEDAGLPLFGEPISQARHVWLANKLGFGQQRITFDAWTRHEDVPYRDYMNMVRGMKSLEQWKTKLRTMGAADEALNGLESIGGLLDWVYENMWEDL